MQGGVVMSVEHVRQLRESLQRERLSYGRN